MVTNLRCFNRSPAYFLLGALDHQGCDGTETSRTHTCCTSGLRSTKTQKKVLIFLLDFSHWSQLNIPPVFGRGWGRSCCKALLIPSTSQPVLFSLSLCVLISLHTVEHITVDGPSLPSDWLIRLCRRLHPLDGLFTCYCAIRSGWDRSWRCLQKSRNCW